MRPQSPSWFWHSLWATSIVLGLGLFALYAQFPVDGATGDLESFTAQGFRIQRVLEARNGLRVGDIIVRAGGHDVEGWLAGASRGPEWRVGGTVTYEILRDGQTMSLPVRLAPLSVQTILRTWAPQLFGAAAFFAVGTFVFWRRPHELAARLLMLFGISVALQYWGDAYNLQYSIIPFRWPLWVQVAYEHGTYTFAIATICLFALVFPEPHPVAKRFPRGVPLVLYASYPVAIGVAMLFTRGWGRAIAAGSHASWGMAMAQIGLALAAGVRSYLTVREPVKRAQIRWIVWTAAIGAAVLIPGYVIPLVIAGHPFLSHPFTMVAMSVLPVVLAIVILRYRLFDIEIIINRSLVYGTLTALLGGIYLALIQVLRLFVQLLLQRQDDTLVSFMATLFIVLAFNPLRSRVQVWIDRAFYRAKVDYETLLPEMSDRLATSIVLDQLSALLTRELPRRTQIAWAELCILEPTGTYTSTVSGGKLPSLPVSHPSIEHLQRWAHPLLRLDLPPDVPPETVSLMEEHGLELIVPLMMGSELVGLYALGPKLSGDAYSHYDVRLLRVLGQQAAVSAQNARLYHQIEEYSHSLEDQVKQRTHELQTAYRDLAQQHATLNVVLDNIADGLVVTDLQGQIILLNPVFARMVAGRSPYDPGSAGASDSQDDLIGLPLNEVSPDASLPDAIARALQLPSTVITVDSTWRDRVYRASACALAGSNHPVSGVVTVFRDITQEVEMARVKDEFVAMVSHELRTPLTSIIGFTHLIYRSFTTSLQPRIDFSDGEEKQAAQRILGNLEIIISQGERLTRLINNILDLSRLEAGHMQWEIKRVQIAELIASSVEATESLAREKGLAIETEIDDDVPTIYGDRDRLIQVMTNLLSNAIKFTDRGQIRIRAWRLDPGDDIAPFSTRQPNVDLRLPATETCVAVSVQDTGTGIAEADLPHVFERFRQVGDQRSGTRRPGTGLGLTICSEIVEYHGGQIWVESQLGIGSRFVFTLCTLDSLAST